MIAELPVLAGAVQDTDAEESPLVAMTAVGAPGAATSADTTIRKFAPNEFQDPPAFDDVKDAKVGVGVTDEVGELPLFFQAMVLPDVPDTTTKYCVDAVNAVPGLDDVATSPFAHVGTEVENRSATLVPGWPLDDV